MALGDRSGPTAAGVASDGQDFLVVWQRYTFEDGDPHDVVGRIVYGDGTLGSIFVINESRSPSYNPVSVAYNGSHYLVAWNHDTGPGYPAPTLWDVLGRCVGTDGSVLGGELSLATGAGDQVVLPCGLASHGDGFLLTWITSSLEDISGADVYGQYLNSDGSLQGSALLIAGGAGGQLGCGLSYGSGKYLCVITDNFGEGTGDVVGKLLTPGDLEPSPVYRFWAASIKRHFYTISVKERDTLLNDPRQVWKYEGVAFQAFADDQQPGTVPVYRFWCASTKSHFYTLKAKERDKLLSDPRYKYEREAWYAFPGTTPAGTLPVYRFWGTTTRAHFYTIKVKERDLLLSKPQWKYEGVAWYAYGL
jgi:hypothetical protein